MNEHQDENKESALKGAHEYQAKLMYWRGYNCAEISRLLAIPHSTVKWWKERHQWDNTPIALKIAGQIDARLSMIIAKAHKSEADYKEMNELGILLERTARMEKFKETGKASDLNPKIDNRALGRINKKKERAQSALFGEEQIKKLKEAFLSSLYPHQLRWYEHSKVHMMRQYVKSRQIGATYYFALEALITALETGKNQIFISASKNQAYVFKSNIAAFVESVTGVQLKGENFKVAPNTMLYFLGTNSNTVQSYSGDLYIDEYFWIPRFEKIQHVASGMTVHDDRRITYFSTPSVVTHEAYPLWTGEHFNQSRPKKEHIQIDISHKALQEGRLCADGYFRQLITIEDAIALGFNCVSLEKLRLKFPPGQYENLLMCEFVNDFDSVFKMAEIKACMVDSWVVWEDFEPLSARPLGDLPVWIGYDPSRTQDDASLVVVAPPEQAGGVFRVVDKQSFQGLDFENQAKKIQDFCRIYNVEHIAIDATGIGIAVYDLVKKFYPRVEKIIYSVERKNEMVIKAKQLMHHGRLQFDQGWVDLAQAFLTIYQDKSGSGRQVSYKAQRTQASGHADLAWALMHALIHDPLGSVEDIGLGKKRGFARSF